MGDRGRVRGLLIAAVVAVGLSSQGCGPSVNYPSPPPPRWIPTLAGVVDHSEVSGTGLLYTLTDGRTVYEPHGSSDVYLMGGTRVPGDLILARMTDPKFIVGLKPIGWVNVNPPETAPPPGYPGCWEAWVDPSDAPIAWDMGSSLLFEDGLELPKASNYVNYGQQRVVDGRTAWTRPESGGGFDVCANSSGQIEWVRPKK